MKGRFIDSHCHLDEKAFPEGPKDAIERARTAGVERLMAVAGNPETSRHAVDLAREYDGVSAAIGVHPHEAASVSSGLPDDLVALARDGAVSAIGETGLDYFYDFSPRFEQQAVFSMHLEWAKRERLPVVIHVRDAFDDAIRILGRDGNGTTGVIHCFSGRWEHAVSFLDLGYSISFAGPVTYRKNEELRSVASRIPIDRILCETDSPYLSPQSRRGKRNEPVNVVEVYELIATIRGMDVGEFSLRVRENFVKLFGIEEKTNV
jgi:TatD DNase family protein